MRSLASRQAIPSSASRTWKISSRSDRDSDTTRAPSRGMRVTSLRPSSRRIASRNGPRLIPSRPASVTSDSRAPGASSPRTIASTSFS